MQTSVKPIRYTRLQIYLHWAVVLLIAAQFFSGGGMAQAFHHLMRGATTPVGIGATAHVVMGLSVLALTLLRLALRATHGAPAQPVGEAPLLSFLARLTHWGIYALLILVPVSGAVAWFAGVGPAGAAHEVLKTLLLLLIGLHVLAAVFHQIVLKTNLIARMNPYG